MKKYAMITIMIASLGFMYSCGPSAKQIEEKRISDSLIVVAHNDSVKQVVINDSIAKAKVIADSIANLPVSTKKGK